MTLLNTFSKTLLLSVFILLMGCSSTDATPLAEISPKQAAKIVGSSDAVIIDVRTQAEWDAGHIPGAIHIPVAQLNSRLAELEQYKDSPVIMQCRSGKRSAQGAVALNAAGFTKLYNMDGGILAWDKAGLETE